MIFNRKARKFVQDNGGMVSLYQDIVDYFVDKGFLIYEVKKDYLYLHFGNMRGKAGIEILQLKNQTAMVTYGAETPHGMFTKHEIKIRSHGDYKGAIERIEPALNEFGAITPLYEQTDSDGTKNYPKTSDDETNNDAPSGNSFFDDMDEVLDKAIFQEEVKNMKRSFQLNYDVPIMESVALAYSQAGDFPVAAYTYIQLFFKDNTEMKYLYGAIFNTAKMGKIDDAKSLVCLAEMGFEKNYRIMLANAIVKIIEDELPLANMYISDAKELAECEDSDDYDFTRVQRLYNDAIYSRKYR